MEEKEKRTWVYLQRPANFEIPGCSCGNNDVQWSEYVKHLWCEKCQKDFIPEHNGVFDGPILINVAQMLGMSFSRLNLLSGKVEVLDEEHSYTPCEKSAVVFKEGCMPLKLRDEVSRTMVGWGNLVFENFKIEVDASLEVSNSLYAEVFLDFPHTQHFKLSFTQDLLLEETQVNKEFKRFVLNQSLQHSLTESELKKQPKV